MNPNDKLKLKIIEERINEFAREAGEEIGPFTMTAIHKELKDLIESVYNDPKGR